MQPTISPSSRITGRSSSIIFRILAPERRNETKRFIMLVDTIYDQALVFLPPPPRAPIDLLTAKKGTEGFEFDRTVSRLIEMQSEEYARNHRAETVTS